VLVCKVGKVGERQGNVESYGRKRLGIVGNDIRNEERKGNELEGKSDDTIIRYCQKEGKYELTTCKAKVLEGFNFVV
jgi:hypothetical protein